MKLRARLNPLQIEATCESCSDYFPAEDMFWVEEEPGMPVGYYCYECDANLITGYAHDPDAPKEDE